MFINSHTAEKLMESVRERKVSTPQELTERLAELKELLNPEARKRFIDKCNEIDKAITETCTNNTSTHCLESGCSLEGGRCLDACLTAGQEYYRLYSTAWIELYRIPANRV